jgi:hypothetical protein
MWCRAVYYLTDKLHGATLKNLSALKNQENRFSVVRFLKHSQKLWEFRLTPWLHCWLDNRGIMVRFLTLARDLFSVAPWPFRSRTQPPVKWLSGSSSLGVKGTGRKVHHSPSPSALDKNAWIYAFTSPCALICDAKLGTEKTLPFTL